MSSGLAQLQARFQAHVLDGDPLALRDVGAVCRDAPAAAGLSAGRRLAIYRHAYRTRLLETLRDSFGHTWRYLGDEWFDLLAGRFMAQHPSQQRNLRWYGAAWPQWLAGEIGAGPLMGLLTPTFDEAGGDATEQTAQGLREQLGTHAEVAELAQLDWALRRAFDAADAPTLGLAELATIAPEAWDALVLRAQPSCSLMGLQCNTLALWHALDQDLEVPPAEQLAQAVDVLVWRVGDQPHFRSLVPLEAVAVTALLQEQSFGALCALLAERLAAQSHADPDVSAAAEAAHMLRRWIDDGLLTSLA
jgi:hypothetical protein